MSIALKPTDALAGSGSKWLIDRCALEHPTHNDPNFWRYLPGDRFTVLQNQPPTYNEQSDNEEGE
jgi:hypothetical protein